MRRASRKQPHAVKANGNLRKVVFYVAGILLLGAALVWLLGSVPERPSDRGPGWRQDQAEIQTQSLAAADYQLIIPDITPARFRNAAKAVEYVGSQECIRCHLDEHKSYLETSHSRSLAAVDVSREPPDGEFRHELSGRHYRVSRDGETLKLREFIQDSEGREVVLADYASRFALGSGNYSRMYLVKFEDFLIESPMTWYPRRGVWGMSAGYEKDPQQVGFGREIDAMCLYCHSGRFETIDGDSMRLKVSEMPIGCERCHGPGALHVKERQAKLPISENMDDSIANPRHLARERQEDICAQCHLSATADVNVSGRSKTDFRPGMKLSDFVVSYRIGRTDSGDDGEWADPADEAQPLLCRIEDNDLHYVP